MLMKSDEQENEWNSRYLTLRCLYKKLNKGWLAQAGRDLSRRGGRVDFSGVALQDITGEASGEGSSASALKQTNCKQ